MAPVNEAAAMLLTRFSEAVYRQHRATKRKHLKLEIEDMSDRSKGGK